jgi:hypothetical protein
MSIINGKALNDSGAGIYIGSTNNLTLSNSTLSGNSANNYGGGIFNDGDLTLSNSTLSGNSANDGGGIFNYGTATVSNSTLSGNSANDSGGGIFNYGTATVSNSTLSGNSANDGGGIFNDGDLTLSNSTLSGNSANDSGGGIFNDGDLTLSNSTLIGNSANDSGGGIFNDGDLTLSNSTLSGNSAYYYGGGIYNAGGTVTLNDSTLSGNFVTYSGNEGGEGAGRGGGIYNSYGTLIVSNSTLSGNSANNDGGGIFNAGGEASVEIGSSIVAGNTASDGREIYLESGRFISNGYNLFGYSGDDGLSGVETADTDVTPTVALNKIIAPLGNYGGPTQTHALVPGSVAINAGDPTITTADQRGVAPVGTRDVGAYESKGFALVASNGNQSTTVNTAFANPLTVNLVETAFSSSLPVEGIEIQLSVPNTGASATLNTLTGVTDSTGAFTFQAIANPNAGSYAVQATSLGIAGTEFSLTNTPEAVQEIPAPSEPAIVPPVEPAIVLPFNLQAKDTPNSSPSLSPTGSVLCVAREGDQSVTDQGQSQTDPYKGVATCGAQSGE